MNSRIAATLLLFCASFAAPPADAARVRVARTRAHTVVRVHRGFPLRRALPSVYVRAPRVRVRVAPRVFLPPLVFGAVVVASNPAIETIVWRDSETIDRGDGWTEFTLNAEHGGSRLLLEVARSPAQVSFAEVVFDNGDAQVVDFDDHQHDVGIYSLLEFKDGRKVDHVRIVAMTEADEAEIRLLLVR